MLFTREGATIEKCQCRLVRLSLSRHVTSVRGRPDRSVSTIACKVLPRVVWQVAGDCCNNMTALPRRLAVCRCIVRATRLSLQRSLAGGIIRETRLDLHSICVNKAYLLEQTVWPCKGSLSRGSRVKEKPLSLERIIANRNVVKNDTSGLPVA